MSAMASTVSIWGRILLHNKLVTQEQWDECFKLYVNSGNTVPIEDILESKRYITAKHAALINAKIAQLIQKHARHDRVAQSHTPATASEEVASPTAPAPAPSDERASPAAPITQPQEVVEAGEVLEVVEEDDQPEAADFPTPIGHVEALAPTSGAQPLGTPPATDQAEPETNETTDDDTYELTVQGQIDAPAGYADEVGWAETEGDQPDAVGQSAPAPAGIKLSEEEHDRAKRKLVIESDRGLLRKRRPAPTTAPAEMPGETAAEQEQRLDCPVAPLDLDPDAVAIMKRAIAMSASDLHLTSGTVPFVRQHGKLVFFEDLPPLDPQRAQRMVLGFMDDRQQQVFLRHHDVDFAFDHEELGRSRVNAMEDFHGPGIIFRLIPREIPTLESLGLPSYLAKFTEWQQGMILVTGPAGCGKSTTAAALIDLVNTSRRDHIVTIEDPVEFVHHSKGCNVTQRQVPIHTRSTLTALRATLREDPDVIMVGEMRDLPTISLAIRAAETGHLVIGTLQTRSATRTIDRLVDVFPPDEQAQIRTMLAESLRGIIAQQLVPRADGKGRIAAVEVLYVTGAASNLIRDSKTYQLLSVMQTGRKVGQRLMDDSLAELVAQGIITKEGAAGASEHPERFK